MTVRIGVSFDGFAPTREAIALAERAVAAGAKSLWMAEHLGYREAITSCMAFAMKAPGTVLVPTAVSPYLWHPMPTAMAMATLEEVAPGCVAIAVGTGYLFFGTSRDPKEALDAVRQKLAFVMRNKFLGANIKASGIAVDQEAVIAAIARRDLAAASLLVPDEAVEAFGIAGTPEHCRERLREFIAARLDQPVPGLLRSAQNCALPLEC